MDTSDFKIKKPKSEIRYGRIVISASLISKIIGYTLLILAIVVVCIIGYTLIPKNSDLATLLTFSDPKYFGTKVTLSGAGLKKRPIFIVTDVFDVENNGSFYFDKNTNTLIFESLRSYFNPSKAMTLFFHYELEGEKFVLERRLSRVGYVPFKEREISEYSIDSPYF